MSSRRQRGAPRTPQAEAHKAVADAIKDGTLVRPAHCELCSEPAQNAHHHSYEPQYRLDVAWVCDKHHGAIHSGKVPEPRTGRTRTREECSRGLGPDVMVKRLASGGSIPSKAANPDRWAWAAAYLAANPVPIKPPNYPHEQTMEARVYLHSVCKWAGRIPKKWADVDLSTRPYTTPRCSPGEQAAMNRAWEDHLSDLALFRRLVAVGPWLTAEERRVIVAAVERTERNGPPMMVESGHPVSHPQARSDSEMGAFDIASEPLQRASTAALRRSE